ncbi:MAG: lamin tail domain-containing protein, partial [Verrucomicrobiota bacterium]
MKTLLKKCLELAALCVLVSSTPRIQAQNGLLREVYSNVCCGIDGLLNNPNYPGNPSIVGTIPNFEAPANFGDQYGQRVRGYLLAPQTGNYTFWIASDDQSQLFISGDEQSTLLTKIAEVFGATGAGDYEREPNQRSAPIRLEAGKYYYIEAIMVEGGGGDNLSVRWQLPDGTIEEPIPENRLFVELIGPQITRQPSNIKVTEAQFATFSVQFANLGPLAYQWERNGVAIPGETNLTLTLPSVKMSDSGSRYRLRASNQFGEAVSSEAVLTVNPDVTQPFIVSAQNAGENNLVTVTFSEPVDLLSAANRNNYSLSGGVVVLGASLDSSGRTVILRTTSLTFGTNYTITVNNIKDLAAQPNLIEPDTRIDFTYGFAPLNAGTVYGKSESPGPSSRRTGLVISEIMYHPAPGSDGRNLQYIELYNTSEVLESIGGYRLTGAIDYTFPEGTFISKTNYLVVAASPLDVQSFYGLTRVYGPYANTLDDKGTIRLLNQQGAVMLEFEYDSKGAWPSAPDGAGPSLVLAHPSYGEADPRAWAPGEFIGGTPGRGEPQVADPNRGLVINEFLAHTDDPQVDFIELYNYTANPIDLSGMFLSDSIETNKFQIPEGTIIQPLGFVSFDQNQLGFSLSASGEKIILRNKQKNRVIDCIDFGPQANGISMGRYPDGAPEIKPLQRPTPSLSNARVLLPDIVINEIMYKPVSRNSDEDYVELFNRSTRAINLNGWRLEGGIGFTFTSSFTLNPGAYLVVAKNLDLLRTNNPGTLTTANSVGNFSGNLSSNGERIALSRPEAIVSTNSNGKAVTNISYVVVNEVRYYSGGQWPQWADGGGSS